MQTAVTEIDFLLDSVRPAQVCASSRQRALLGSELAVHSSALFRCAANWSTRSSAKQISDHGPQHQTLRHRGQAPSYHRPIELTRGVHGTLVMHPDGLALEPSAPELASTEITASSIRRLSFYADCVEIIHGSNERTLLCSDAIELLDLKFEVYYGRQCGFGFNGV